MWVQIPVLPLIHCGPRLPLTSVPSSAKPGADRGAVLGHVARKGPLSAAPLTGYRAACDALGAPAPGPDPACGVDSIFTLTSGPNEALFRTVTWRNSRSTSHFHTCLVLAGGADTSLPSEPTRGPKERLRSSLKVLWTLRRKTPTEKDAWGLPGLKRKNKKQRRPALSSHFSAGAQGLSCKPAPGRSPR